ncbi:hypothetical protein A5712_20680 [Mycobacterium sp. E2327]|uniref:hypothetical protein n=1 Tax=Mycobacterium sp. E2327 TaxID=1834132 RepID=UPI0007FDE918|nr:hypothetical protein [Mycobacterium sp. E2327]OBI18904.1 hypothetical protein A5712_20680 [Mycobacterium sp. E2327]
MAETVHFLTVSRSVNDDKIQTVSGVYRTRAGARAALEARVSEWGLSADYRAALETPGRSAGQERGLMEGGSHGPLWWQIQMYALED